MQRTCFILLGSVHSGVFLPVSDGRLRKNSFYWDLRKCIFSDWHIFLCDSDKSINLTQACNKNWCKLLINLQSKLLYFCRCFFFGVFVVVFLLRDTMPLYRLWMNFNFQLTTCSTLSSSCGRVRWPLPCCRSFSSPSSTLPATH